MRYFLDLKYHGGSFHGWQSQKNAITVQQTLEEALMKVTGSPLSITGSGRTDTGVHAQQQVAHVDFPSEIQPDRLGFQLNAVLPESVAIQRIRAVTDVAHARFDADRRRYDYYLHHTKDPFLEGLSYQFHRSLNLEAIKGACDVILQTTDFESFSKVKTEVNHFNCEIYQCEWQPTSHGWQFTIIANRFLRGMVRALVGTLLEVGLSKLSVSDFALIVKQKDRRAAGAAAPPHGLYLSEVTYPKHIYIN